VLDSVIHADCNRIIGVSYIWISLLRHIDDATIGFRLYRDKMRSSSSSILDHFPDIEQSNEERIQAKHRCILLTYTSEHLPYMWISLLQHIDDAKIGFRLYRDELSSRSSSSSILDHFPDIEQSKEERIQAKHRCILLTYTSEHLLYI
jgi:deoxyhypusine synthase